MSDSSWIAVINPNAGGGRVAKEWPLLSNMLKDRGFSFEEVFTTHRYHAVELVIYSLKRGFRNFISVGGDGTLHEIVNGIFYQKEVPVSEITLAVLPAGSANDWTRMYRIPKDYDKAIETVLEGRTVMQDVARVEYSQAGVRNSRYMVNVAGVGLDANICLRCNASKDKGKSGDRPGIRQGRFQGSGQPYEQSFESGGGRQEFLFGEDVLHSVRYRKIQRRRDDAGAGCRGRRRAGQCHGGPQGVQNQVSPAVQAAFQGYDIQDKGSLPYDGIQGLRNLA